MELEEMKTLWTEMSAEMEKQKKLTDSIIINMTKNAYKNKINKIWIPEMVGLVIAFIGAGLILVNFQKLDSWYLQACGLVSVIILLVLPVLSIRSIRKMRLLNISGNNYKQSLIEYANGRKHFVFIQKLSFYLAPVLMLTILPVVTQLINGKDFFKINNSWMFYTIGFPLFYVFARWVFKCYTGATKDAENILKELGSSS